MPLYLTLLLVLIVSGCSKSTDSKSSYPLRQIPPFESSFSYRLGDKNISEAVAKRIDVDYYIVDGEGISQEDIATLHENGIGVICYFSAGSAEEWRDDYTLFYETDLGNDLNGWAGEQWLNITSENVKTIMLKRLDTLQAKGCDGVEADNVDGFNNDTGFTLSYDDQLAYNRFLADAAHQRGLSIALKNDFTQMQDLVDDFDFVVSEEGFQQNNTSYFQPFLQKKKAVFNVEYKAKYLQADTMVQLCNASDALHVNSAILPKKVDGRFEYNCKDYYFQDLHVGFGGGSSFLFHKDVWLDVADMLEGNYSLYSSQITDFNQSNFDYLTQNISNSRYVMLWVTQGWQESWYNADSIQKIIDMGKIPVFVYWYFGDHLNESGYLEANKNAYFEDVTRLGNFLKQFHGKKFLLLEPEFNKENILLAQQQEFVAVISEAIDILRDLNIENLDISLTMMDTGRRSALEIDTCGYSSCALGDKVEWSRVDDIYTPLLSKLDFISFQEMVGQFSRDPQNPGGWDTPNPKAYTDEDIGIDLLAQRVDNFATFLKDRYNKPVMLAYSAIATATWSDDNTNGTIEQNEINATGWESKGKNFYKDINSSALFAFGVMELFDNPQHDAGGYQFFMQNEYHLGIVAAKTVDLQNSGALDFKSGIIEEVFKAR